MAESYIEYLPERSQCHRYTAAPAVGAWSFDASVTVRFTRSGTPFASVRLLPKLRRMSWRTMPESSSTFGPLDPSPGYGPAVSLGTAAVGVLASAFDAPRVERMAAAPANPKIFSASRREASLTRSSCRPSPCGSCAVSEVMPGSIDPGAGSLLSRSGETAGNRAKGDSRASRSRHEVTYDVRGLR